MIVTGPQKVAVEGPMMISYTASAPFIMYGLKDNVRTMIFGPHKVEDRYFVVEVKPNDLIDEVEIFTGKKEDGDLRIVPHVDGEHEYPDQTPLAFPAYADEPENLASMIQRMVREQISVQAHMQGDGTFEEEDDFDIEDDDDYDPTSPYEERFLEMTEEEPVAPPPTVQQTEQSEDPEPEAQDVQQKTAGA
jgi:hypothetical protein